MAKRYTFRLETLLRLRQQREDEQKRVVAARLREIRTLRQRRHSLETEITRQTSALRQSLTEANPEMHLMKLGRHWVIRLRRGVLDADAEIAAQRAQLAQERIGLTEARRDAKVLEKLKERRHAAYRADLDRREQAELDEMNVSRFAYAETMKGDNAS